MSEVLTSAGLSAFVEGVRIVSGLLPALGTLPGAFSKLGDWVAGAVVGIAVSALVALAGRILRRRAKRSLAATLTGFDPGGLPLVVIGAPLRAKPGTTDLADSSDALPLFGYGPLSSYALITTRLLSGRTASRSLTLPQVVVSSQYPHLSDDQKRRDLLVLGYPAGNEAARTIEPALNLPVKFADDGRRALVLVETGEAAGEAVYEENEAPSRLTVADAGLLVRARNPLNPSSTILYLAGCETFGVKLAAEALSPEHVPALFGLGTVASASWRWSWLPRLRKRWVWRAEFVAVVSGEVQQLTTGSPRVERAWTRDPKADCASWTQVYPRESSE